MKRHFLNKTDFTGKLLSRLWLGILAVGLFFFAGCSKVDYTKINEPAYLRVFNNLNYVQTLAGKDDKVPFFCMLINPVVDASGMPTGAEIVGDFLDKRDTYAPPYPSHVGSSTSVNNPEYPGKENVLVGPILNGFDLSSWAQVPSGRVRIMFAYRPKNAIPFFQLENNLKKDILIDTTIQLTSKEVYTLHLLQKDFVTKQTGILLRQENFHKLSLSDSLVYVNFYNMSAKGFWQADESLKDADFKLANFKNGIKDDMNVFLTLYENQNELSNAKMVPGFNGKYLTNVKLNTSSNAVSPYVSFPLWASTKGNGIKTDIWQRIDFLVPGMDFTNNPFYQFGNETAANWAAISCIQNGKVSTQINLSSVYVPNLLVNIHSGVNNPQTFATVNTIEIVNSRVYLTTIQRKYAPPVY